MTHFLSLPKLIKDQNLVFRFFKNIAKITKGVVVVVIFNFLNIQL